MCARLELCSPKSLLRIKYIHIEEFFLSKNELGSGHVCFRFIYLIIEVFDLEYHCLNIENTLGASSKTVLSKKLGGFTLTASGNDKIPQNVLCS